MATQASRIKEATSSTIDFQSELRREKLLVSQKVQLKVTNPMNAFNMLQDLRHLILLDFRSEEEYDKSHIRKAIRVDLDNYKAIIASLIVSLTHKKESTD